MSPAGRRPLKYLTCDDRKLRAIALAARRIRTGSPRGDDRVVAFGQRIRDRERKFIDAGEPGGVVEDAGANLAEDVDLRAGRCLGASGNHQDSGGGRRLRDRPRPRVCEPVRADDDRLRLERKRGHRPRDLFQMPRFRHVADDETSPRERSGEPLGERRVALGGVELGRVSVEELGNPR